MHQRRRWGGWLVAQVDVHRMPLSGAEGCAGCVKLKPLFVIVADDLLERFTVEPDIVWVTIDGSQ